MLVETHYKSSFTYCYTSIISVPFRGFSLKYIRVESNTGDSFPVPHKILFKLEPVSFNYLEIQYNLLAWEPRVAQGTYN